jgi:hypothetical protein
MKKTTMCVCVINPDNIEFEGAFKDLSDKDVLRLARAANEVYPLKQFESLFNAEMLPIGNAFIRFLEVDEYELFEQKLFEKYGVETHAMLMDKITDEEDAKLNALSVQGKAARPTITIKNIESSIASQLPLTGACASELRREGVKDGDTYQAEKNSGENGMWITAPSGATCVVYTDFFEVTE